MCATFLNVNLKEVLGNEGIYGWIILNGSWRSKLWVCELDSLGSGCGQLQVVVNRVICSINSRKSVLL
jgi:hypothetical protein